MKVRKRSESLLEHTMTTSPPLSSEQMTCQGNRAMWPPLLRLGCR